jgi:hypothetical protein
MLAGIAAVACRASAPRQDMRRNRRSSHSTSLGGHPERSVGQHFSVVSLRQLPKTGAAHLAASHQQVAGWRSGWVWLWPGRLPITSQCTRTSRCSPLCGYVSRPPVISNVIGQRHETSCCTRARWWLAFCAGLLLRGCFAWWPSQMVCARAPCWPALWRWPAETHRFGSFVGTWCGGAQAASIRWGAIPSVRVGSSSTWRRSGQCQIRWPRAGQHCSSKAPVGSQAGFGFGQGGCR